MEDCVPPPPPPPLAPRSAAVGGASGAQALADAMVARRRQLAARAPGGGAACEREYGEYADWTGGAAVCIAEAAADGVAGSVWDACHAVGDCVRQLGWPQSGWLRGRRVVELGAGTGLLSVLLAHLGAHVVATDCADAMDGLRCNVARNVEAARPRVLRLDCEPLAWGAPPPPHLRVAADVLVVSECIYNLMYGDLLLASMRDLARPRALVLFTFAVRQPEAEEAYLRGPVARYFIVDEHPCARPGARMFVLQRRAEEEREEEEEEEKKNGGVDGG
jgi:predicted nicotinamide N-methyase